MQVYIFSSALIYPNKKSPPKRAFIILAFSFLLMYYNRFVHYDSTLWIRGTENIRFWQAALWTAGLHVFGRFIHMGFPQACKRQRKENWVNELIEIISMLVGIPASVITILTASKNYIKSKKTQKDPSASLAASDGSDDNLAK